MANDFTEKELLAIQEQALEKFYYYPVIWAVSMFLDDCIEYPVHCHDEILDKLEKMRQEKQLANRLVDYEGYRDCFIYLPTERLNENFNFPRNIGEYHLWRCHWEYKETKNPLFAWDVFEYCQRNKISVPAWVNDYLVNAASKALELSANFWVKGFDNTEGRLPSLFGFDSGGGSSFFRRYQLFLRNKYVYFMVLQSRSFLKSKYIDKEYFKDEFELACEFLLDKGIKLSYHTVKDLFYKEDRICYEFKCGKL